MTKQVTKFDQARRLRERMRLALPVRVYGRESKSSEWTEMTRLIDVSPFGARFSLSRPIDVGRLVQLTLKMPQQLRVFDHAEDQYRVWAIVRNVRLLDEQTSKGGLIEVGVGFIGKRPPRSYDENPTRRYEIGQNQFESETWNIQEDSVEQLSEVKVNDKRKQSRQLIPIDVLIEVFDGEYLTASEHTVTENISRLGAAIFTTLDLQPGTFLRMTSHRYNASVLAVVRGRRTGADGITRLHLEFMGSEWPL